MIVTILVESEMIIPKWLFELPVIEPERNEFQNSKNDRVINYQSN